MEPIDLMLAATESGAVWDTDGSVHFSSAAQLEGFLLRHTRPLLSTLIGCRESVPAGYACELEGKCLTDPDMIPVYIKAAFAEIFNE